MRESMSPTSRSQWADIVESLHSLLNVIVARGQYPTSIRRSREPTTSP
jgi:hypothetical protein